MSDFMKRLTAIILLFSTIQNFVYSQNQLKLLLKDEKTQEAVGYAHIHDISNKIGEVSDTLGRVQMILPHKDSLIIQALGYDVKTIYINKDLDTTIFLSPTSYLLNEVVVKNIEPHGVLKTGISMKKNKKTRYKTCNSGQNGYIVALEMEGIKQKNTLLELSFFVTDKINNKEKVRIRLLSSKQNTPSKDLLNKSVIIPLDKRKGWQTINLKQYNISLPNEDFFLGIEFLSSDNSPLNLCVGFSNQYSTENKTWVKRVQGNWVQLSFLKDKKEKQLNLMLNLTFEIYDK